MNRRLRKTPLLAAAGLAAAFVAQDAAADAPAIAALSYSADIGANIVDATTFAGRQDFVSDDLVGTRVRQQIPGLPDNVNLADFHVEANGDVVFALDTGVTLGGNYYASADVIRFNGTLFTKEFDSVAAGVPSDVRCDGVARLGDTGKLLLSFDKTFTVAGTTIRPADVITYSAGAFGAKVLDAQALGLPDALNVDGIDTFRTKSYLLVSFDTGGTLGGVTFSASDVLQLRRADGTWSLRFAVSTFSDRWERANLDGVAALNSDTIFQDDLEP